MKQHCPFCGSSSERRCEHLALEAPATDFVRKCIEKSHAERAWRTIRQAVEEQSAPGDCAGCAEFLWLETAFCDRLLRKLHWFGRFDHEWRDGRQPGGREQWVLLWSKDARRFWWEFRDYLEAVADDTTAGGGPGHPLAIVERPGMHCPVCGVDNLEGECAHLAFYGDDLRTKTVIECCGPRGAWEALKSSRPGFLPEFAASFFHKFKKHFPPLLKVESTEWTGGAPGLNGLCTYVWAKEPARLEHEIHRFLERTMAKRQKRCRSAGP